MGKIEYELWHLLIFVGLFLVGIFKSQIIDIFNGIITLKTVKSHIGNHIKILANGGTWEQVKIIGITQSIPFFRSGGVMVVHESDGENAWTEKMPFSIWRSHRIKYKA